MTDVDGELGRTWACSIPAYTWMVYPNFPYWPPGARTANGTTLCR